VEVTLQRGICIVFSAMLASSIMANPGVEFRSLPDRIDVVADGELFTSYHFSTELPKPVLVPLRTPSGIVVSRRHPLTAMEGGSMDHPHHVGLFFAVDNVNGNNFWKNTGTKPQIRHISLKEQEVAAGTGRLVAMSHWNDANGETLLEEERIMTFLCASNATEYAIDFEIVLTAQNQTVTFYDTEEGVFAIRLADALRESGARVIPAPGEPLPEERVAGTGLYFSSNSAETAEAVWGKRARWVALQGIKDDRVVGVAILNHPESINYPTYWHARGYGLFSANPLGQGDFQRQSVHKKNPVIPLQLTLEAGKQAFFRFLVIVYEGRKSQDQIEARFKQYVGE
jgi:hypothetical protein